MTYASQTDANTPFSVYSGTLGNRKVAIAEFRGTLTPSKSQVAAIEYLLMNYSGHQRAATLT